MEDAKTKRLAVFYITEVARKKKKIPASLIIHSRSPNMIAFLDPKVAPRQNPDMGGHEVGEGLCRSCGLENTVMAEEERVKVAKLKGSWRS